MAIARTYGGLIEDSVWILIKEMLEASDADRISTIVANESAYFLGLTEHDSVKLFRLLFDLEFLLFSIRQQPNLTENLKIVLQIPPELFSKIS